MKLLMGFIILLVALVAITGCTQTATPEQTPATTVATTIASTEVTTVATTVPVTTETVVANVTASVANVTATANVTAAATTAAVANVTATPTFASQVTKIHITSTGFVPQNDVLLPGTGVFFVNDDNVTHSVITTGNSSGMFNSGDIVPNSGYSYSFSEKTGTYTYALGDNTSVTGTFIVKAPCTLGGC